jgi:2-polyprenyl-3-methyl-5-hydroxy-6-metoxy-1,4-benzoquinol methylase
MMIEYDTYWKSHHSDFCITLPVTAIWSRLDLFREDLHAKRVLHVGCTDWPFTEEKLKKGELLHQMFADLTPELYGLDIENTAIHMMRDHGIPNLFCEDICNISDNEALHEKKFDCIIISEVLEHLLNPGLALSSIKRYIMSTNPSCEIIFTVPNYQNFHFQILLGLRGKECVHPDHKYYFSYRTFRTLVEQCGFQVTDFHYIIYTERSRRLGGIPLKAVSRFFPALAPHLYFKCKIC